MSQSDLKSLFHVSQIEITYRNKIPYENRIKIDTSRIAYDILLSSWDTGKIELVEQFKILLLDNKCNCLGISEISTGGTGTCIADPKIIFATALKAKASRLILAHNHPSGHLKASEADISLTHSLAKAGKIIEIPVLDHLIITPQGYYSFVDNDLMPGWESDAKVQTASPSLNIS